MPIDLLFGHKYIVEEENEMKTNSNMKAPPRDSIYTLPMPSATNGLEALRYISTTTVDEVRNCPYGPCTRLC